MCEFGGGEREGGRERERETHNLSTECHILSTDEVDTTRNVTKLFPHMDPLYSMLHQQVSCTHKVL